MATARWDTRRIPRKKQKCASCGRLCASNVKFITLKDLTNEPIGSMKTEYIYLAHLRNSLYMSVYLDTTNIHYS